MKIILRFAVLSAAILVGGAALAQSVTGTWHGHIVVDRSTLPKPTTPQQKKVMDQKLQTMDAMLAKTKLTLTLKPNKTFTFVGENMPNMTGTQMSSGVYTVSPKAVTITAKLENGKKATADESKPQDLIIGPGGKTLTFNIPASPVKISMVFSR